MSDKIKYDIEWFESAELGERYCRIRIPGRPELYVFPKDLTNTYALAAVKYGSCDSKFRVGGKNDFISVPDGVAHFLEHKMFTDEDGSDAFEKFSAIGADANAYTTYDRTVYLFNCTDNFESAYKTLLHMVTHPYFTADTVKKEEGIIEQEIAMYNDDPDDICYQNLMNAMYKIHPVKISVCGTARSISQITPATLYDCHRTFYNASNMVTVVCGRVDPVLAAEILGSEIPYSEPVSIERFLYSEPAGVTEHRVYTERQVSKPLFCIGIKDSDISPEPGERLRRHLILRVLCRMIFASSGDLYNELYNDGLLTSPFEYNHEYTENYSHVIISGASDKPDEVYLRVKEHINSMLKNGIDGVAFERCRRVILSDIIGRYDSTEDIANTIVGSAFAGQDIFNEGKIVSGLTVGDAGEVMAKFFGGDAYSLSVTAPIGSEI